ncbi:MAG TPA: hypothetical protein DDZ80_29740 [Cyanobacteria bacterium UBA8803]|nr:hypothetical protein [Cyanobacteria bacterium UBA9273]HBL62424.1 hypothetical protein [Cyanobacteria bacterium UBA8803]
MFAFESDGYWLFNAKESELPQIEKANERFLTKDKASRKQLESLKKMKVSRKLELPIPPAIDYPGADTQLQPET